MYEFVYFCTLKRPPNFRVELGGEFESGGGFSPFFKRGILSIRAEYLKTWITNVGENVHNFDY